MLFAKCEALEQIKLPNTIKSIGEMAFVKCPNLKNIEIPKSVTEIGENAFYGINEIYYNGSAIGAPWGAKNIYKSKEEVKNKAKLDLKSEILAEIEREKNKG